MTQTEILAELLGRNLEMLKSTIADFSDADMLVRPCPQANHGIWQLGHLAGSESRTASTLTGSAPIAPADWTDKFTKETAAKDDPNFFPKKAEVLDVLSKARAATIAWVRSAQPADFAKPTPERLQKFAPTFGHLVNMTPSHMAMHVGQFQVIRRKLGRPILF